MNGPDPHRLAGVIGDAMRLAPDQRREFVRSALADPIIREEALSLLESLEEAGEFMQRPTVGPEALPPRSSRAHSSAPAQHAATDSAGHGPGDRIGRYTLIERIGEGGFGEVFAAEQREPVRRAVALKVIKAGMDTREVIARFDQERHVLAMMDHPGIASVLDAGATSAGRPFFVMELVRGQPITRYCREGPLATRPRLELFRDVCRAVQHAHTKGVIHRDIKPANVLVTRVDGRATAKVIDFGIAKATRADPSGEWTGSARLFATESPQLLGTPEYMSPEQCGAGGPDVDARTDVYSLGVLLYELLTGATPFEAARLRSGSWEEFRRIIREEDPPRPSTRIAALTRGRPRKPGSGEPAAVLGSARSAAALRGDLDWIVMRCLEKDRSRRYMTADALAADIERHLAGEPVEAAPPSAAYRARKFVARHRVGVMAGAFMLASLVVGLGVAVWEARAAQRAGAEARQRGIQIEKVAKFQAAQLAGIDATEMGRRLRQSIIASVGEATTREGRSDADSAQDRKRLEELLGGANMTSVALGALDENIFARALEAVHKQFAADPIVRASLLQTMAVTLRSVGLLEKATAPQAEALAIRRKQLGPDNMDTLESLLDSAVLLRTQGKLAEAQSAYREALDSVRRVAGPDHRLAIAALGDLAEVLQLQGRVSEAEPLYREAADRAVRALGPDDHDTLGYLNNLGFLSYAQGKLADAEHAFATSLQACGRTLGKESEGTLAVLNNLASVYQAEGKYAQAEAMFREGLEQSRRARGDDHPATLQFINNLGNVLYVQGKLAEAETYTLDALSRRRRVLGDDHWDTLQSMNNMGVLLRDQGRFAEAEPYLKAALDGRRRVLGPKHQATLQSLDAFATLLRQEGKPEAAEPYAREALDSRREALGEDHPDTLQSLDAMGAVLMAEGKPADAEPFLRRAVAGREQKFGKDSPITGGSRLRLGEVLTALARFDQAEPVLLDAERALSGSDVPPARHDQAIGALVALYQAWDKVEPTQAHGAAAATWVAQRGQGGGSGGGSGAGGRDSGKK